MLWAMVLPGLFAGYVPWRYFGLRAVRFDVTHPFHVVGAAAMSVGAGLLGLCIWEFARSGRGTLAPMDAPRQLVVQGLYRYVRNPMYLSVTTIVFGELLLTRSSGLLIYWLIWFTAVNLFVMRYEEPTLRRRFGPAYDAYARQVRRWIPRFPGRAVD